MLTNLEQERVEKLYQKAPENLGYLRLSVSLSRRYSHTKNALLLSTRIGRDLTMDFSS
jgi:hypothetical protein